MSMCLVMGWLIFYCNTMCGWGGDSESLWPPVSRMRGYGRAASRAFQRRTAFLCHRNSVISTMTFITIPNKHSRKNTPFKNNEQREGATQEQISQEWILLWLLETAPGKRKPEMWCWTHNIYFKLNISNWHLNSDTYQNVALTSIWGGNDKNGLKWVDLVGYGLMWMQL